MLQNNYENKTIFEGTPYQSAFESNIEETEVLRTYIKNESQAEDHVKMHIYHDLKCVITIGQRQTRIT